MFYDAKRLSGNKWGSLFQKMAHSSNAFGFYKSAEPGRAGVRHGPYLTIRPFEKRKPVLAQSERKRSYPLAYPLTVIESSKSVLVQGMCEYSYPTCVPLTFLHSLRVGA